VLSNVSYLIVKSRPAKTGLYCPFCTKGNGGLGKGNVRKMGNGGPDKRGHKADKGNMFLGKVEREKEILKGKGKIMCYIGISY
jgi:hypothetical protein